MIMGYRLPITCYPQGPIWIKIYCLCTVIIKREVERGVRKRHRCLPTSSSASFPLLEKVSELRGGGKLNPEVYIRTQTPSLTQRGFWPVGGLILPFFHLRQVKLFYLTSKTFYNLAQPYLSVKVYDLIWPDLMFWEPAATLMPLNLC